MPRFHACRVAFSGGADSVALLHALTGLRQPLGLTVRAIHVDHGLAAESAHWADFCRRCCDELDVPLEVVRVEVVRQAGESLEMAARRLRYAALASRLDSDEALLTAHHRDDQAETFLLNLMNGAGGAGLAAIPPCRPFAGGWLMRPLLGFGHQQLVDYLRAHDLPWIEDPGNADTGFDRNYLRHEIMPALKRRWPAASRSIARAAAHQQQQLELTDAMARIDHRSAGEFVSGGLRLDVLGQLTPARRANLLRYWLRHVGPPIRVEQRQLAALQHDVIEARGDAQPVLSLGNVQLRREYGLLVKRRMYPPVPSDREWLWRLEAPLVVDAAGWYLEPEALLNCCPDFDRNTVLKVRCRRGGERFRPGPTARSRPLKQLFQQWRVPVRVRNRIPLLFRGDELVVIWGYAVASHGDATAQPGGLIKGEPS